MNRKTAERKLKEWFGIDHFYDEQWGAIESLLAGNRVSLIQKTGFGKSLVYQFVAMTKPGTTVIFSPLIALMEDQVNKLQKLGIEAAYINSRLEQNEKEIILAKAKQGGYKMLYITPERQKDEAWLEVVEAFRLSMVVVDEAHCISVWGHDFRPDYRQIVKLVQQLKSNFPVLACTATATKRVEADIAEQIDNGTLTTIRGDLSKSNFSLNVYLADSQEAKMESILEEVKLQDGIGIIYTGTKVEAEIYSNWLQYNKVNSVYYHAGLDPETRKEIEDGLMLNKYDCIVSTNALGMGLDKSDIRYVIHTQVPKSPLHYYQEIGRAGRDGLDSKIILYFQNEDEVLPLSFINNSKPKTSDYEKVIQKVKSSRMGLYSIVRAVNMKQSKVKVILKDLVSQRIFALVKEGRRTYYEYIYGAPKLNTEPFEHLRKVKLLEWESMKEYIYLDKSSCRMRYLKNYLGDESLKVCGRCDNDLGTGAKEVTVSEEALEQITGFRETFFPRLDVSTDKNILLDGVAASFYGVSNVGKVLHRCKYETKEDFPDHLLKLCLKAFRKTFHDKKFDLVLYVPPTKSGDLVKNFAEKIARSLKLPVSNALVKVKATQEQKIFQSAIAKKENLKDAFDINIPVTGMSIVLIDDIFDSGQTIKTIAELLKNKNALEVVPLTIAKTVGGR